MALACSCQSLIDSILLFGRELREKGFKITPPRLEDVFTGLSFIEIGDKGQFRGLLRSNFVSSKEELGRFETVFDAFWGSIEAEKEEEGREEPNHPPRSNAPNEAGQEDSGPNTWESAQGEVELRECPTQEDKEEKRIGASLEVVEVRKDFSRLSTQELTKIEEMVLLMARKLGERLRRRFQTTSRSTKIDFRRSFRSALHYGGEFLELRYKRPRPRPNRIYLLLDISGSMDVYGQFFLLFMYGIQQTLPESQCFVFSTHLTWVTPYLKASHFEKAWTRINLLPVNWSGGTDIGSSLMEFYTDHLGGEMTSRDLVVVVSDGWDRGNPDRLDEALELVHRSCRMLFWLNPLLGSSCYQPLTRGMQTALPYIDSFLPLFNLDSFDRFCRKVEAVCRD